MMTLKPRAFAVRKEFEEDSIALGPGPRGGVLEILRRFRPGVVPTGSEVLVDVEVVRRVVLVVSGCLEDRIEVDRVHAEIGEVVELLLETLEVSPIKRSKTNHS